MKKLVLLMLLMLLPVSLLAADWSLPTLSGTTYADFLSQINSRLNDAALWFDSAYTTPTNTPTNAKRWNSTAKKPERWTGSAWVDLTDKWAIHISGNADSATACGSSTSSTNSTNATNLVTGRGTLASNETSTYGNLNLSGNKSGYAGIRAGDYSRTFMWNGSASGVYKDSGAWAWYFDDSGVLQAGAVPAARVSGTVDSCTSAGNASQLNSQLPSYYLNASNFNAGTLSFDRLPAGTPIKTAIATTSAVTTSTAAMPVDDTIPQSSEGWQTISVSFTPIYSTSRIQVEYGGYHSGAVTGTYAAALFSSESTNAISATAWPVFTNGAGENVKLLADVAANSTSTRTYSARIGGGGATTAINGYANAGTRYFGGAAVTYIKVTEIKQ